MINVKVVPRQEGIWSGGIPNLKYYTCKHKKTQKQCVFLVCPPVDYKRMVIWLNSEYEKYGIGYDYFPTLADDYYDFHEIKDAELTFYV